MWYPFDDFPREIGIPSRIGIVNNMQEFVEKVNLYNGKATVFVSLYSFDQINGKGNRGVYGSARVKQIYFDVDEPRNLDAIRKLHNYCLEKDYLHTIVFSGGGFHLYLGVEYPNNLDNKKGAIFNAQIFVVDECGLKVGVNGGSDIDRHIIGNLAQLVRVPGTYNLKRKRFCISVSNEDLNTTLEEIKEKAKTQNSGLHIYGHRYFDLNPFDSEPKIKTDFEIKVEDSKINVENLDISRFPPCIQKLAKERFIKHFSRYVLISFLKELGLSYSDVVKFLESCLAPSVFYHCVRSEKQPYFIFRRSDLSFPNCDTLKEAGLCADEKCEGAKLYE
jgi:hypothetical protein